MLDEWIKNEIDRGRQNGRYYVYLHECVNKKNVFYVGKGSGNRWTSQKSRSKKWHKYLDDNGGSFNAKIVRYFDD